MEKSKTIQEVETRAIYAETQVKELLEVLNRLQALHGYEITVLKQESTEATGNETTGGTSTETTDEQPALGVLLGGAPIETPENVTGLNTSPVLTEAAPKQKLIDVAILASLAELLTEICVLFGSVIPLCGDEQNQKIQSIMHKAIDLAQALNPA